MADPLFPAPAATTRRPAEKKPPVPKEITISFLAFVVSAVVGVVQQWPYASTFVQRYQQQTTGRPESQVDPETLKWIYYAVLVVIAMVVVLIALRMRAGRNWARVALTVVTVLGLMNQAATVGMTVFAVIALVIAATSVVYMYVPQSNAYFALFRPQPPQRPQRPPR
jgi:hypothetical protein